MAGETNKNPKLMGAIEAIVFASGDPVSMERMAQALETDVETVEEQAALLMASYNRESRGIRLVELDGALQFCTSSEYGAAVRKALEMRRNTPLSQAAMEVLAVVAYNQPVTKAYVEQVRGVDCGAVISGLVEKGLLEEAQGFFQKGPGATAVQSIGYKELAPYFRGEIPLEAAAENIRRETRRYAKRQLTWFSREEGLHWLYVDEPGGMERLLAQAEAIFRQEGILPWVKEDGTWPENR